MASSSARSVSTLAAASLALLDLDPQRLERCAAIAQALLAPRELGVAALDLLGLADELGRPLAECKLLPGQLCLTPRLALGQLGLASRELGLASRQLRQCGLALRQLVGAALCLCTGGLERCLGAGQLGLAGRESSLQLAQGLLAALVVGRAALSQLDDGALELGAAGLQAGDLRACLGLLDAGLVELGAHLGVRGLALAHASSCGLEVDLALAQLLLQAIERLAAELLRLAPAVELGLARGDGLLQQRGAVIARLELPDLLGRGGQLMLELAAHLLALLLRGLELGRQPRALRLEAGQLRLQAGSGGVRRIALGAQLLELGVALVERGTQLCQLGECSAGASLDVVQLCLGAGGLRLRGHERALALGDLLGEAIEIAVALLQRGLRALDLGGELRRPGQLGAQRLDLVGALGQRGSLLGELGLELGHARALGAGVVELHPCVGERRARILELALELGRALRVGGIRLRLLLGLGQLAAHVSACVRVSSSAPRARPPLRIGRCRLRLCSDSASSLRNASACVRVSSSCASSSAARSASAAAACAFCSDSASSLRNASACVRVSSSCASSSAARSAPTAAVCAFCSASLSSPRSASACARVSSSSLRAAASASLVAAQLDRLLLETVLRVARRGQRLCGGRGLRVALDQLRLQRGHPLLGGAGQLRAVAHRRELALELATRVRAASACSRAFARSPTTEEAAASRSSSCVSAASTCSCASASSAAAAAAAAVACSACSAMRCSSSAMRSSAASAAAARERAAGSSRSSSSSSARASSRCFSALSSSAATAAAAAGPRPAARARPAPPRARRRPLRGGLALLGELLQLLDALGRLGRGLDLRARLLEARALPLELGPELRRRPRAAPRARLRTPRRARRPRAATALTCSRISSSVSSSSPSRSPASAASACAAASSARTGASSSSGSGASAAAASSAPSRSISRFSSLSRWALSLSSASARAASSLARSAAFCSSACAAASSARTGASNSSASGAAAAAASSALSRSISRLQLALALCALALQRVRACRGLLLGVLRRRQLAAQRRQQLLGVRRGGRGGQLGAQPLDLSCELALTLALGGLERVDARRQRARALRGLVARVLRGRQRLAQRRQLLLGVRGSAGCGELGAEPLDLLLELALTQVGELAVDDVLEPRAQLEQLDLVDRDLALELAQLLGIDAGAVGLGRAGLAGRRSGLGARGDLLEFALAVGERRLQALDLDVELVHELRILEHGLRDLAAVALGLDVALELRDALLLPFHGIAQLHRVGSLLGQPLTAVRVLALGDGALAFFQYLQALFELRLQLLQNALALLLDALLDRVLLHASQRSAQAAARASLRGLVEAVLESAVMGVVCDGASSLEASYRQTFAELERRVSCRGSRVAAWRKARAEGSPDRLTFVRAGTMTTAVFPWKAGSTTRLPPRTFSGCPSAPTARSTAKGATSD